MPSVKLADELVLCGGTLAHGDVEDLVTRSDEGAFWPCFFDDAGTIKADDVERVLYPLVVIYIASVIGKEQRMGNKLGAIIPGASS